MEHTESVERDRSLYVALTIDCLPAATRWAPHGPRGWELSARSIYGFCKRLLDAGFPPTLFLTPRCAHMHGPLVEELRSGGAELGLLLHPHTLDGNFKQLLGRYHRQRQHSVIELALREYVDGIGFRPWSVRSAMFSANDDTFPLLYQLGFRQGSLSSPGRRVSKHAAVWTGAAVDAHYVNGSSRLKSGDVPFLEMPVTTDSTQEVGGLAPELEIERGTFDQWHRPLIDGQLSRMEREQAPMRALCLYTSSACPYHDEKAVPTVTLSAVLSYLNDLNSRYDVRPVTLSAAHAAYRQTVPLRTVGRTEH